ncbi:PEP-utilizing enzyme [Alphaproteobacteria bacterium]|nr:PEP-utilizing enzyme [Alphaproteobacteria bacterium]
MILNKTKGEVLEFLSGKLEYFEVPNQFLFTVNEWKSNAELICNYIADELGENNIAIRSSSISEDDFYSSKAGEFDSFLDVNPRQQAHLRKYITEVINSYDRKGFGDDNNQVLIQQFVDDVDSSGVVFTRELNRGSPYYVINYDDVSGLTNTVTSGSGEHANKILYVHRNLLTRLKSERFNNLLLAVRELEEYLGSDSLDMEFALRSSGKPVLLQVRPITSLDVANTDEEKLLENTLVELEASLPKALGENLNFLGKRTVFGQMPDWNPAEIIGRLPRALSVSLYKFLITDHAWAEARQEMGYKTIKGSPLMVIFAGQPYVDVRLSFNSFLPADISANIGEKVVDKWIATLIERPELHDKVEFNIASTSYRFDLDKHFRDTVYDVLSDEEIALYKRTLSDMTKKLILSDGIGSISNALEKIDNLPNLKVCDLPDDLLGLNRLLDQCVQSGTIPFAILARHGFIGVGLIESLATEGFLTEAEKESFFASIETVASQFVEDINRFQTNSLSEVAFMAHYGHLRPGTYDILSRRYDDVSSDIFRGERNHKLSKRTFELNAVTLKKIDDHLMDIGWNTISAIDLLGYCRSAITAREYSKFCFTRTLSLAIEWIAKFGGSVGLSRDEMSHIPLDEILETIKHKNLNSKVEYLRQLANANAEEYGVNAKIVLPQIIHDVAGARVIPFQVSRPNFITNICVVGETALLEGSNFDIDIASRILLIENADPGFDWVFSKNIIGLITKYGGANSHMAIRCAEFQIPAAIGCGEKLFSELQAFKRINLDCSAGLLSGIN